MEPGEIHANTKQTAPAWFRVLMIDPSMIFRAAKELGIVVTTPHLKAAQIYDPRLFRPFAAFHASFERPATTLERQSRFATCVRLLLEHCTERPPVASRARSARVNLEGARELIHDRSSENVTLDNLAAAAGLSRFHLVRAFAREFGLPPHAYQIQVRLARARALLATGLRPAAVAAEAGFADQSHLTRHFKFAHGITPGQYLANAEGRHEADRIVLRQAQQERSRRGAALSPIAPTQRAHLCRPGERLAP